MEWSLLLLLPLPVVQVAVAHPVDDLGQLAESTQLADYDSGHFVTRGAGNRARWQGFKNILFDGRSPADETSRNTSEDKCIAVQPRTTVV